MPQSVRIGIKSTSTGKYILSRREDTPGLYNPSLWDAIGGGVEAGETPYEALLREIGEEAEGADVFGITFLGRDTVFDSIASGPQETNLFMYMGRTASEIGDITFKESQEAGFFTLEEITGMDTVPYLKRFLARYRKRLESF